MEVDPYLAVDQWRAYVAVFVDHGWAVTELEPLDAYPDGVFVEDTVVIFDELAVLTIAARRWGWCSLRSRPLLWPRRGVPGR